MLGEFEIIGPDLLECGPVIINQIHLINGEDYFPDAEQRDQITVPHGLDEHTFSRVNQDDGKIGGGGTGHHIAGILLMPRRIGDDEFALVGGEEAIGNVNSNALFALRLQSIQEKGVVYLAILGADALAFRRQSGKLVFEQQFRIPQQAADKGALAIVHAAAGDEAKKVLLFLCFEIGVDFGRRLHGQIIHQKYPSCFFFSIEPA